MHSREGTLIVCMAVCSAGQTGTNIAYHVVHTHTLSTDSLYDCTLCFYNHTLIPSLPSSTTTNIFLYLSFNLHCGNVCTCDMVHVRTLLHRMLWSYVCWIFRYILQTVVLCVCSCQVGLEAHVRRDCMGIWTGETNLTRCNWSLHKCSTPLIRQKFSLYHLQHSSLIHLPLYHLHYSSLMCLHLPCTT